MSTTPRLSDLRPLAKEAIEAATLIQKKSISVFLRDGENDKERERHLNRLEGTVVIVEPLQEAKVNDQSGTETSLDVLLAIGIEQNPAQNANDGAANVDILDVLEAVTNALTRKSRHPGGEFFKIDSERAWVLSVEDEGLWRYVLYFTKEMTSV